MHISIGRKVNRTSMIGVMLLLYIVLKIVIYQLFIQASHCDNRFSLPINVFEKPVSTL